MALVISNVAANTIMMIMTARGRKSAENVVVGPLIRPNHAHVDSHIETMKLVRYPRRVIVSHYEGCLNS